MQKYEDILDEIDFDENDEKLIVGYFASNKLF